MASWGVGFVIGLVVAHWYHRVYHPPTPGAQQFVPEVGGVLLATWCVIGLAGTALSLMFARRCVPPETRRCVPPERRPVTDDEATI